MGSWGLLLLHISAFLAMPSLMNCSHMDPPVPGLNLTVSATSEAYVISIPLGPGVTETEIDCTPTGITLSNPHYERWEYGFER